MIDFQNAINWDEVTIQKDGCIYHGHRINIENMSNEEREFLKADLTKRKIVFSERKATVDSPQVRSGDLTVRVIEPESVEKLRYIYFNWAMTDNGINPPIKETISEYNERCQRLKERAEKMRENEIKRLQEKLAILTGKQKTPFVPKNSKKKDSR